jgi:lipopolysaccharide export system protein LptA
VTLTGNVVVTQGANVLRGDRMVVDLTTGVSRVESNQTQRVEGLFNPSSTPQPQPQAQQPPPAAPAPQKDAKGAKSPPAKPAPGAPIRIN